MMPLASESAAPSIGAHAPAALACHALHEAAQIVSHVVGLPGDPMTTVAYVVDMVRVYELVTEAAMRVGALQQLLERQEHVIEEMRVETIREHRYATRVEERNSEHVQSIISLTSQLDDAHAVISQIRDDALTHDVPRDIAVGGA